MKRILLIFMMICFLFGCEKDKEKEKPIENGINVGVKYEGYKLSEVNGNLKYESDKYINNEFDNELPTINNVKSFEYLENNHISIVFNSSNMLCDDFKKHYQDNGYNIISSNGYDFVNDYEYVIYSGIKNNYAFVLECKKDLYIIRMEVNK